MSSGTIVKILLMIAGFMIMYVLYVYFSDSSKFAVDEFILSALK